MFVVDTKLQQQQKQGWHDWMKYWECGGALIGRRYYALKLQGKIYRCA